MKYRRLRRDTGDYLCLSDDRRTIYRVYRYEEDGTALSGEWPNEKPIYGTFWNLDRLHSDYATDGTGRLLERDDEGRVDRMLPPDADEWAWAEWASVATMRDTMAAALESVR